MNQATVLGTNGCGPSKSFQLHHYQMLRPTSQSDSITIRIGRTRLFAGGEAKTLPRAGTCANQNMGERWRALSG